MSALPPESRHRELASICTPTSSPASSFITLSEPKSENSEAPCDDEADPAHPLRHRPVRDHNWPIHINPRRVEQRHQSKDYSDQHRKRFSIHERSRFVPKVDSCIAAKNRLFDHLVGGKEQRWEECTAERVRWLSAYFLVPNSRSRRASQVSNHLHASCQYRRHRYDLSPDQQRRASHQS